MELDARLSLAAGLARQAGALLIEGYGTRIRARRKGELEIVTEYDERCERLITSAIRSAFPEDSILAEEGGQSGDGLGCWLIDPLDGTTNYARGIPIFAVSIAYAQAGRPLAGVVYDPLRNELFQAALGQGAWLNGQRLGVSAVDKLDDALLVTGFPYDVRTHPENNLHHHAAFTLCTQGVRRLGSAALDLAYVACGRLDGYWETVTSPWDVGAGLVLVTEAGGMVSRTDGGTGVLTPPCSVLATNGRIHGAMLGVLGRPAPGSLGRG